MNWSIVIVLALVFLAIGGAVAVTALMSEESDNSQESCPIDGKCSEESVCGNQGCGFVETGSCGCGK